MSREFIISDKDIINLIGDVLGASMAVASASADYGKRTVKSVNNKVKQTKEKVKECVKCQHDVHTPKLTDYIDRVIAQDKATVIFWKDGTKTSVKCSSDEAYDYEKGLAMAILKYIFGNKYYKDMQKVMAEFPYVEKAPVKEKPVKETKKNTSTKKSTKKSTKTE